MTEAEKKYADIIDLPHHRSDARPAMSRESRAAQFSPFAALTGYDAAVAEAGRLTEKRITLTEEMKTMLGEKLSILLDYIKACPIVTVTYFVPDKRKSGGAYVTACGTVKEINEYSHTVVFTDKTVVPIDDIVEIESEIFCAFSEF